MVYKKQKSIDVFMEALILGSGPDFLGQTRYTKI